MGDTLLGEDIRRIGPGFLLSAAIVYVLWLASIPGIGWIHPEFLGSAVYIWNDPHAGLFSMLRKVFDWKAFDPNVNRVRPLNDLFEVIDAIARPFSVDWFQSVSVPSPSTVLTAVAVPSLFYAWARMVLRQRTVALMLALILMSTTGFLSLIVAYIHPAKKLEMVLLCAMLFFIERSKKNAGDGDFWKAILCCYLAFFADETGLANFGILTILYWRECFTKGTLRIIAILLLPIAFFATTKWILPEIYVLFSVHGRWDALADSKKFAVFAYLADIRFYGAALTGLGRSCLTVIGVKSQLPFLVIGAAVSVIAVPILMWWVMRTQRALDWTASGIVLTGTSGFATLLDWYPFPYEVSYLGSFNYYYHSIVVVPAICWLTFGWCVLIDFAQRSAGFLKQIKFMMIVPTVVVAMNLLIFLQVNTLVRIIHYYPYDTKEVMSVLQQAGESTGHAVFQAKSDAVTAEYMAGTKKLFGSFDAAGGYRDTFSMVQRGSIMDPDHLSHLVRFYYPWRKIDISVNGIMR